MTIAMSDDLVRHRGHAESAETLTGMAIVYSSQGHWEQPAHDPLWEPVRLFWQARMPALLDDRIRALSCLAADWDSYGADPLNPALLTRVQTVVSGLLGQGVPMPDIAPASSGSVIVGWRGGAVEIEMDFDPAQEDAVLVRQGSESIDYEGPINKIYGEYRSLLESALTQLAWPQIEPPG